MAFPWRQDGWLCTWKSVSGEELLPPASVHHLYLLLCNTRTTIPCTWVPRYGQIGWIRTPEQQAMKKGGWGHVLEGNTIYEHTLETLKDHTNLKDNYCHMLRYLHRAEWEIGWLVKEFDWAIRNTTSNSILRPSGFVIGKIPEHLGYYQALSFYLRPIHSMVILVQVTTIPHLNYWKKLLTDLSASTLASSTSTYPPETIKTFLKT